MFTITLEEKINQKYEEMLPFFGRKKEEIKNKIAALEQIGRAHV